LIDLPQTATLGNDMDSSRYRWAAWTLIVLAAVLRLLYLAWFCPLDLSPDEALYWEWSRRLDWCYQSKGPLVAWLIRLSCELFGDSMIAVRFPAVVCGSLLLVGLHTLTDRIHRSAGLALGVVAIALTLPMVAAGSTLMTIDAPFTCAWMWALVFAHRASFPSSERGTWAWAAAGTCIAIGILAKHTMLLWAPCFAVFLLTTPAVRAHFMRPGFWTMIGIGALGGLPILIWNALNGWVTLAHTQGHAGLEDDIGIRWLGPLNYVAGQGAILLGLWFVAWATATWVQRPSCETRPEIRFLWWMSAPVFVFFGLFAFTNGGGGPNWPIAGYLSGAVLAAGWWSDVLERAASWQRRALKITAVAVGGIGGMVTLAVHAPIQVQPIFLRLAGPATLEHPLPIRRVDPTSRLRGWHYLAQEVDRVRAELKLRGIDAEIVTERWTHASELAFYCDGRPTVYCLGVLCGDRVTQYDLWRPNPMEDANAFRGRTFLLVGTDVNLLSPAFSALEPVRTITYRENDQPIARWTLAVAHGYLGPNGLNRIGSSSR
jgi:hypothetical protein